MSTVSVPEASLLSLSRAALGQAPAHELARLLVRAHPAPEKLGPTALGLLEETWSKGTVLLLARSGGWHPLGGKRLWERGPLPELRFTPALLRFFQWALKTPLTEAGGPPAQEEAAFSPAEEAVVASLLSRAQGLHCDARLFAHPSVRASPLLAVVFAAELGAVEPLAEVPPFDVARHGPFLEGLAEVVTLQWLRAEEWKGMLVDPAELRRRGLAQQQVIDALFERLTTVSSRRLASGLVRAGLTWLADPRSVGAHYGALLRTDASLSDRQGARMASGALLRAAVRAGEWHQAHRHVRFIDDEYAEAQALVKAWEALTEPVLARAQGVSSELGRMP